MIHLVTAMAVLGLAANGQPSTMIAFVLVLATDRPKRNGVAFFAGWVLSLLVVFLLAYAGTGGRRLAPRSPASSATFVLELLLGFVLLAVAVRQFRRHRRRESSPGPPPRLVRTLKGLRSPLAAGLGVYEQPWVLTAAAALAVAHYHRGKASVALAFVVFGALSTAGIGGVFLYFLRRPETAAARLERLRTRLVRAGPTLFMATSAGAAVYLLVDGTLGLLRHW